MAIRIINSENSFVRFGDADGFTHCNFSTIEYHLPVYEQDDVAFQFIVAADTASEADALCTVDGSEVSVELVGACIDISPLIAFTEKPQRVRLSETQLLYYWPHGFPGWPGSIDPDQCFRIRLNIETNYGELTTCSNIFQRITDPCFSSVIDYANEDDAFGFKYCSGGATDDPVADPSNCDPTVVQFFNESSLSIPYTAQMQDKYGLVPSVQIWIYDETGQLVNMGVTATFDAVPPTVINADFGGQSSGIIVIR